MARADIRVGRIGIVAGALALTIAAAVGVALVLPGLWDVSRGGMTPLAGAVPVPAPVLEAAPQPDLHAYRAEKLQRLHSTGWIDQARGIAHIPIDDAITLLTRANTEPPAANAHSGTPVPSRRAGGRGPVHHSLPRRISPVLSNWT